MVIPKGHNKWSYQRAILEGHNKWSYQRAILEGHNKRSYQRAILEGHNKRSYQRAILEGHNKWSGQTRPAGWRCQVDRCPVSRWRWPIRWSAPARGGGRAVGETPSQGHHTLNPIPPVLSHIALTTGSPRGTAGEGRHVVRSPGSLWARLKTSRRYSYPGIPATNPP